MKTLKTGTSKSQKVYTVLMAVALLVLLLQTIRDSQRNGDFIGYLNAGNLVLQGADIYSDYLNTWPPFFSVFSVPLALADAYSPTLVRLVWLLGSWVALFFTMRMAVSLFVQKKLLIPFQSAKDSAELAFSHPLILVPFLLSLRALMDNSGFLQINLYILALCMGSVYFFHRNKLGFSALMLGFSVALKVFPIFIILYFLYKRAHKVALLAIAVVAVCCGASLLVFGWQQGLAYHEVWFQKSVVPFATTNQMNQSLMAALGRLFSHGDTGIGYYINLCNLSTSTIKMLYYSIIILAAAYPLYLFRHKLLTNPITLGQALQWALLFSAIPLLSPVAWKAYFVFLWVPFFAISFVRASSIEWKSQKGKTLAQWLYYASLPCLILSSELFMGVHFSDVLEVFNIITIGAILLCASVFTFYLSAAHTSIRQPVALLGPN